MHGKLTAPNCKNSIDGKRSAKPIIASCPTANTVINRVTELGLRTIPVRRRSTTFVFRRVLPSRYSALDMNPSI